mgnify:CR=1 FL=1
MVFDSPKVAGLFALELTKKIETIDWINQGFSSQLSLRVALHAGLVCESINPITKKKSFIGSSVCKAARIEPLTPAGLVFASQEFAALASFDQVKEFSCVYVGQMDLPKKFGVFPTYRISES